MKILELKQNIFKENEVTADKIRDEFKKQKKLMINVMSSPGSGKYRRLEAKDERRACRHARLSSFTFGFTKTAQG